MKRWAAWLAVIGGCGDNRGAYQTNVDAAVTVDSSVCYGSGIVQVCLAAAPTEPLVLSAATRIDTGDASRCARTLNGGDYCVVAASNIDVRATVRASGPRPLVLLSTDSITLSETGLIDVGSHRVRAPGSPDLGAGADPAGCGVGTPPSAEAGGAGGSFAGIGGVGGRSSFPALGGAPASAISPIMALRGGCPGQAGNGFFGNGSPGHGGGAVLLIAVRNIELAGGIVAGGEGGGGGVESKSNNGGGGGGAGGMIVLDAPAISVTGLLAANGGGGGEASQFFGDTDIRAGADGEDATSDAAANGGATRASSGDGGNGSAGIAAGPGAAGGRGVLEGGGGGGGGAGIILVPAHAVLGTRVSPEATVH